MISSFSFWGTVARKRPAGREHLMNKGSEWHVHVACEPSSSISLLTEMPLATLALSASQCPHSEYQVRYEHSIYLPLLESCKLSAQPLSFSLYASASEILGNG